MRTRKTKSWLAVVKDKLLLVDVHVTCKEIGKRTCGEVLAAEDWAEREYLYASDNDIERVPKPEWLPPSETQKRLAAAEATVQ
jgi:hypothetical protein